MQLLSSCMVLIMMMMMMMIMSVWVGSTRGKPTWWFLFALVVSVISKRSSIWRQEVELSHLERISCSCGWWRVLCGRSGFQFQETDGGERMCCRGWSWNTLQLVRVLMITMPGYVTDQYYTLYLICYIYIYFHTQYLWVVF